MTRAGGEGGTGPRRVGLVVIHGVGETGPGEALNPVVEKLSVIDRGYTFETRNSFSQLAEIRDDFERTPTAGLSVPGSWPVVERAGQHDSGVTINAVELYWADTTRLGAGRLDTVLGLFRVIFESQHLFYAMLSRHRESLASAVRWILLIAAWMLRGPIAALTIVTSAFCTLFLFEPSFLRLGIRDDGILHDVLPAFLKNGISVEAQFTAVMAAAFLSAVWAFDRIRRTKDLSWYDLVFWVGAISLALGGLSLSGHMPQFLAAFPNMSSPLFSTWQPGTPSDCLAGGTTERIYVCGLYNIIIWGWRIWGILLLICTALMFFTMRNSVLFSRMSTSIGILILQFMLWTTVVVSLLYFMLNRAESNALLSTLLSSEAALPLRSGYGNDPRYAELFTLPDIRPDWIARFKFVYITTTFALIGLLFGGALLMKRRRRCALKRLKGLQGPALEEQLHANYKAMPRFLFNAGLIRFLIATFAGVMALVFFQKQVETNNIFVAFRGVLIPVAATIAVLVPMIFGPVITNVVHIARDLIDHHFRPEIETGAQFLPRFFKFKARQPRRERIDNRLIKIIEERVNKWNCDDVIFVAHSQGSVIAYDYLIFREAKQSRLGKASLQFLTFGSPLGTLYQTYFDEYVSKAPVPFEIAVRLKRWINIYRVDDYIGGRIEAPPGLVISNRIAPPGVHVHTDYWSEDYLAYALDELILNRRPELKVDDPASWPRRMPELKAPAYPSGIEQASYAMPGE